MYVWTDNTVERGDRTPSWRADSLNRRKIRELDRYPPPISTVGHTEYTVIASFTYLYR